MIFYTKIGESIPSFYGIKEISSRGTNEDLSDGIKYTHGAFYMYIQEETEIGENKKEIKGVVLEDLFAVTMEDKNRHVESGRVNFNGMITPEYVRFQKELLKTDKLDPEGEARIINPIEYKGKRRFGNNKGEDITMDYFYEGEYIIEYDFNGDIFELKTPFHMWKGERPKLN